MEGRINSVSLRPATPDDLPALLEVEKRVHKAPWSEAHFREELSKPYSQFLVLTDDETDTRVAGYIVFWLMFDECQILNIAVDIPFRGLGHGKELVRKAVSLAVKQGLKRILLEVRVSNTPAIQLYQALGFGICQVRRQFYSDGEDAYSMAIDLNGPIQSF
jgi:[ribosomal protein S18]-alanine N-acetyltransferase